MSDDPALYLDPTRILAPSIRYVQTQAFVQEAKDRLAREAFQTGPADEQAAAQAIVHWVHNTLRPGSAAIGKIGVAPSLEAILSKPLTSCREFAALTCFLLRCHQIPARLIYERMHTDFSLPASLLALLPRAWAGPYLQGHVWVELHVDGRWAPADSELGIFDVREWVHKRLRQGHRMEARFFGVSTFTTWLFPLAIQAINHEGEPAEMLSEHYLVDCLRTQLTDAPEATPGAFDAWERDVRYFSSTFDWHGPFPGLRLALQRPRLHRMHDALRALRI